VETIFRGSLGSGTQTIPWHVNSKLSAGLYIVTLTYGVKKETFQVVIDTKL
jgi:hypothetical protein